MLGFRIDKLQNIICNKIKLLVVRKKYNKETCNFVPINLKKIINHRKTIIVSNLVYNSTIIIVLYNMQLLSYHSP